jgi:5-(carboxyamino)imidazole ribonucleotide mutase
MNPAAAKTSPLTTAIGKAGAKNAALLAVSILALSDASLRNDLKAYRQRSRVEVEHDDDEIRNASLA